MPADVPPLPKQSPINIEVANTVPKDFPSEYLVLSYPNQSLSGHLGREEAGEHKENFYFDSPPSASFDGKNATLQRIHIHAPTSEHYLDGQSFPFEIHFVNPFVRRTARTTGSLTTRITTHALSK